MRNGRTFSADNYLMHHGIKGQKWGVRRFQNKDGSYTKAGKERRSSNSTKQSFDNLRKDFDDNYKIYSQKIDKLGNEYTEKVDKEFKAKTGLSRDEAYDKAVSQNADLDSGKLKYEDSIWKQLEDVEEKHYAAYESGMREAKQERNRADLKASEAFVTSFMKSKNVDKLTVDDINSVSKKVYNAEHDEYFDEWSVDNLMTRIGDSKLYEIDYDDFSIRRRRS